MARKILALDLGGTKTSIALFDTATDKLIKEETFATPAMPDELMVMLLAKLKANDYEGLAAIAVGAPGYWDADKVLRQSLNLPKYIGYPLWSKLSAALDLPIYLKTDVELAAIGESTYGIAYEHSSLLYINMGTGFSGALYKDGELFSTQYSPTIRLDYLVQAMPNNQDKKEINTNQNNCGQQEQNIAYLSGLLVNLSFILSPQIISIGGGKTNNENWQKIIEPAILAATPYLEQNLTYPIKIQKSLLKNPSLYGALKLAKMSIKSAKSLK